jgi:uncharacterized protein YecT (DUF1311 family)
MTFEAKSWVFYMVALAASPVRDITTIPDGANSPTDRWVFEGGAELAGRTIAQCFERGQGSPDFEPLYCVHVALALCLEEHGTNQHAMNDCSSLSKQAWEARLAQVVEQFRGAKTIDPKFGTAEPVVQRFQESQQRWVAWNQADCELQAGPAPGGSMRPMLLDLCLSDHAANRALELEGMAWWWGKSFKL